MKKKALIFDMDNTILHSKIDYALMKWTAFDFLRQRGYYAPTFDYNARTTAQLIDDLKADRVLAPADETRVWELIEQVEREGMREAKAEPGAVEVLSVLVKSYYINVLTNNGRSGSLLALDHSGLAPYIDLTICRDEAGILKPDAAGARLILAHYPQIAKESWYYVGDFWADGSAAKGVGIPFIAYRGNHEEMAANEIPIWRSIVHLPELLSFLPVDPA